MFSSLHDLYCTGRSGTCDKNTIPKRSHLSVQIVKRVRVLLKQPPPLPNGMLTQKHVMCIPRRYGSYTGLSIPLLSPCVKGAGHKTSATLYHVHGPGARDYASQSDWAVPQGAGHKNSFRYIHVRQPFTMLIQNLKRGTTH
jgi:hypothetical protein